MTELRYAAVLVGIERFSLRIGQIDLHLDKLEKRGWEGSLKIRAVICEQLLKWRWTTISWMERIDRPLENEIILKSLRSLKIQIIYGRRTIYNTGNYTGMDKGFYTIRAQTKSPEPANYETKATTFTEDDVHRITPR